MLVYMTAALAVLGHRGMGQMPEHLQKAQAAAAGAAESTRRIRLVLAATERERPISLERATVEPQTSQDLMGHPTA